VAKSRRNPMPWIWGATAVAVILLGVLLFGLLTRGKKESGGAPAPAPAVEAEDPELDSLGAEEWILPSATPAAPAPAPATPAPTNK
jgi:hypothetical protein